MTLKSSEPDLAVTKNGLFYCENSSHVAPLTQTTYYNSELEIRDRSDNYVRRRRKGGQGPVYPRGP